MTGLQQRSKTSPIWLRVAQREIRVRSRGKALWISTVAMVVLIVGGVVALHFLSGKTTSYEVAVTSPAAAQAVSAAAQAAPDAEFETRSLPDRAAAEQAVKDEEVDAFLVQEDAAGGPVWRLEAKGKPDAALHGYLAQAVAAQAMQHNAQALGVALPEVLRGSQLIPVELDSGSDQAEFQYGVTFAFGLLFFLSCQLFGTATANSVVEEKESRVVEVLLAAIPTRSLLVGKVVGNVFLGIAQMALFTASGLLTAVLVGGIPHLGSIVASSGWFLVFYVIGFGTVCCLFAGLGALASRTQDMQSATAPLQLLITATYMCSIVGKGVVVTIASFVPIASTVTMPARVFAGTAAWWEIAASLAIALAFAALTIRIAARAYRSSVLHTGSRLSLLASLRAARTEPAGAQPTGA
ncbi:MULTISPECIES: ABC transporter permease [unclassified Streptomyces]|uniref:ABC transporter permease n=1 Tax=unclassified Streptomyces TaxID=2593676 RepID=UPI002E319BBC|nr:ABC transporter permease [Streptomyces sp. NBC_01278]